MTTRALHLRRERREGEGLDLRFSLCGMVAVDVTDSHVEVTCRVCQRRMRDAPREDVAETYGVEVAVQRGRALLTTQDRRAIERSRRGEENERPRWGTLAAAWQQWARVVDDGAPVRSTSDPGRFGQAMGAGGGTVRTPGGRDDIVDFERALVRACVPLMVGPIEVGAELVRAIVEARMGGKRVWSRTEGRKAGVWRRVPQTYEAIAESLGDGWTRRHVTLVVRHVTREMTEDLVARGVLEARELRRGGRTEAAEMRIPGYDLESWKEIAAHLQTSVSTAQRAAASRGLPVRTSSTGFVYARRADLDAWSARQVEQAAKESA